MIKPSHYNFLSPCLRFHTLSIKPGLQPEVRMWYQTDDGISSHTGQIFLSRDFSGAYRLFCMIHSVHLLLAITVCNKHPAYWPSLLITQVPHCSKKVKVGHLEAWPRGRRENKTAQNSEEFMSKEFFLMLGKQQNDGRKQGGSFFLRQPFFLSIKAGQAEAQAGQCWLTHPTVTLHG